MRKFLRAYAKVVERGESYCFISPRLTIQPPPLATSLHLVPLPQKSITSRLNRRMLHKYLLPILRQIDVRLGDPAFQQDPDLE